MTLRIDTSSFPTGKDLDYESEEEVELLKSLFEDAWKFVNGYRWNPPIADLVLAFGLAPIIGLYLMRFSPGGDPRDAERWVVVGDLPSMHFETDDSPTPAIALRLYCAIAQDWADTVLAGEDLAECYPIPVAPTKEHAEMLLSRIENIRTNYIPLA
ncbi:MAG: hypothetical protein JWM24_526 [Solirubrobacterales bacterium]|nr:hypothetical protein [Solirubrobacterales bacterium]